MNNPKNNIFQVINEDQLNDIIKFKTNNLILVMFEMTQCKPSSFIKPYFVELSKSNKDVYFIIINFDKYKSTNKQHIIDIESTPTFKFYYQTKMLYSFTGGGVEEKELLISQIKYLKENLNAFVSDDLEKKQEIIKKINGFKEYGIETKKNLSINNSLEELQKELDFYSNNLQKAFVNNIETSKKPVLSREEKIDKIKKLHDWNLHSNNQELQKLKYMKNIHIALNNTKRKKRK